MLVAQSYTHQMTSNIPRMSKKDGSRRNKELNEKRSDFRDGIPKFMSSMTSPTSSQPVIIPTKTSVSKRRTREQPVSPSHDPKAIPPSMAALLAVASAHTPSPGSRRGFTEKMSRKERLSPDDLRFTLSSSSPRSWNILQSPPDEEEESKECDADTCSIISASTAAPLSSYRSLSFESMPSLDMELDSESSLSIEIPSPSLRIQTNLRKISSPRSSLGGLDHPLSPPTEHDLEFEHEAADLQTPTQDKTFDLSLAASRKPAPKSLTSNLTASFRLLRSAARSTLNTISPTQYTTNPRLTFGFSTSTPSAADDNLTHPSHGPQTLTNIDALPFHVSTPLPALPAASLSIQLLPYQPSPLTNTNARSNGSGSNKGSATAPPVFLPAASPSPSTLNNKSTPRPREPRENSDFLRVVVLEMNMRRAGKLNAEGRARIWMPARRECAVRDVGRGERWIGESS